MLALIAGEGVLPRLVRERRPEALVCEAEGTVSGLVSDPVRFRLERLGSFIDDLGARGVTEVCFAGRVARPALDPAQIDEATRPLVPRIVAALGSGDDAALRTLLSFFEEAGISVVGVDALLPDLLAAGGVLGKARPDAAAERDAKRAAAVHAALGVADVGQAVVVAGGQVLAVEALPGTDWMLRSLLARTQTFAPTGGIFDDPFGVAADMIGGAAQTPAPRRDPSLPPGGILYKAPKPGQDRRIDLPAIGPETVRGAAMAGLTGIVVEADGVLILDRAEVLRRADAAGLFLWARGPG